jgi:hypothetical protein
VRALGLGIVTAALLMAPASPGAARETHCAPHAKAVVARNADIEAYATRGRLNACSRLTGLRTEIVGRDQVPDQVTLVGSILGAIVPDPAGGGGPYALVADLRGRKAQFIASPEANAVVRLQVRDDGAFVYATCLKAPCNVTGDQDIDAEMRILKHDSSTKGKDKFRVLDTGPALDGASLRLNRSRITWVKNGLRHSARLR